MSHFSTLSLGTWRISKNVLYHRSDATLLLASLRRSFTRYTILSPSKSNCKWRTTFFSTDSKPKAVSNFSEHEQEKRRKSSRAPAAKTSLRRAAVEAQRTKESISANVLPVPATQSEGKIVTAYCVAEQYDLSRVVTILLSHGYKLDPCQTGLYPQVIHIEVPLRSDSTQKGDVFIFPSGTLVAWGVSEGTVSTLASSTLHPAAINPHPDQLETEDLDYTEDPTRENSSIKGDTITLGTSHHQPASSTNSYPSRRPIETVLAKIAFSSGLARSTKLAVLESLLDSYFTSTRSIPTLLSRNSPRLPFTRSFILQKTGQLLSVRAQLNLYSELTDSLPDLFWDSRHELGLEGYYDQMGRALDIGSRIKVLNQKMDYSQEIASVLREQLSEKHSLRLEWIIIVLIAVEVGFEIRREWKEAKEAKEARKV